MFGNNKARGPEKNGLLQVHEVFFTIQGEGPFSGQRAVFVRLTGCNLRCWFCDTKWDDEKDQYVSPTDLFKKVVSTVLNSRANDCDLIVITGGEPMRQDLSEFIELARVGGYRVQIETAGTYWQDCMTQHNVTVVVSPKAARVHPQYEALSKSYSRKVYWKYVVVADQIDPNDWLPIGNYQRLKNGKIGGGVLARPPIGATVYLQPCDEYDVEKNKRNLEAVKNIALMTGYIAGVQLHKLLNVE